jgi:hypothetical protein
MSWGPSQLRIQRLLWHTEVSLDGLIEVGYAPPDAMKCSVRILGNGELFSITGVYQNKKLGRYRAFVTDPESYAIPVLPMRVVVLSPENPLAFVPSVQMLFPNAKLRESTTRASNRIQPDAGKPWQFRSGSLTARHMQNVRQEQDSQ